VVASDGRQFLRRSTRKYDLIVLDAYTTNRYGSGIPYPLVTQEFFQLVRGHLTDDGILACNIIGSVEAGQNRILAAVSKTVKTSFMDISLFAAEGSGNVVVIAPRSDEPLPPSEMLLRANQLVRTGRGQAMDYHAMIGNLMAVPPPGTAEALVLTDDFAPVDGLLKTQPGGATLTGREIDALRKSITVPSGAPP
jgi:spermidine synthase